MDGLIFRFCINPKMDHLSETSQLENCPVRKLFLRSQFNPFLLFFVVESLFA